MKEPTDPAQQPNTVKQPAPSRQPGFEPQPDAKPRLSPEEQAAVLQRLRRIVFGVTITGLVVALAVLLWILIRLV